MAIELPQRFFFYGTLIGGGPPAARRAIGRLRDLGPARTSGRLYAIPDPEGWYPALVEGPGRVAGRLYEATPGFTHEDLAALDAYEDWDPLRPDASLYRRASAEIAGQPADHYVFNQPLPDLALPISNGDFAAWLALSGVPAVGAGVPRPD